MRCKVKVNEYQLNYFRRLARNTAKEIEAYLIGEVVSPELTVVKYFVYPERYEKQTEGEVYWYDEDITAVKVKAEEQGLTVVGNLHSHPNYWPIISSTDHASHVQEQLRIIGVCATMNRKTMVCFWVTESSLPCKIIYAEKGND